MQEIELQGYFIMEDGQKNTDVVVKQKKKRFTKDRATQTKPEREVKTKDTMLGKRKGARSVSAEKGIDVFSNEVPAKGKRSAAKPTPSKAIKLKNSPSSPTQKVPKKLKEVEKSEERKIDGSAKPKHMARRTSPLPLTKSEKQVKSALDKSKSPAPKKRAAGHVAE